MTGLEDEGGRPTGERGAKVHLAMVQQAAEILAGQVRCTPLLPVEGWPELAGAKVHLKLENLQETGAFKIRGALARLAQLSDNQRRRGVVCASAGNHAQGVALAGARLQVPVTVLMPETAPVTKVAATRRYGAEVNLWGQGYDQAYQRALQVAADRGLTFIHPFDDPWVVAGQGTIGLEILQQLPDVDTVVVPVGGGGLIAGVAVALKEQRPSVRVVGVQAEKAPAMVTSFQQGQRRAVERGHTIADGLAVKVPGALTFGIVQRYVDAMVTVGEDAIARAILLLLERAKLVAEGAGAAALAALLEGKVPLVGRVAVVISGGNIDINLLARIIQRGLLTDGRLVRFQTLVDDRPGALQALLKVIAAQGGNILSVYHDRLRHSVALGQAEVELIVETRDGLHARNLREALVQAGYFLDHWESPPAAPTGQPEPPLGGGPGNLP